MIQMQLRLYHILKRIFLKSGLNIPIVGDFHFNGHILLSKYRSEASHLDKFRINPGNVGKEK